LNIVAIEVSFLLDSSLHVLDKSALYSSSHTFGLVASFAAASGKARNQLYERVAAGDEKS